MRHAEGEKLKKCGNGENIFCFCHLVLGFGCLWGEEMNNPSQLKIKRR